MDRKIALVGFSESTRHLAPYDNPEWEIWGCNHVHMQDGVKRIDVSFEVHDLDELRIKYSAIPDVGWPGYLEELDTLPFVWMKEVHPDVHGSHRFPIEDMRSEFAWIEESESESLPGARGTQQRTLFKSTLSYMVAMAIMEPNVGKIALYGVDMIVDFEWGFQRHNLQFYLGWAKGQGIEVIIPAECAVMKEVDGIEMYGYDHNIAKYDKLIAGLKASIETNRGRYNQLRAKNEHLAVRMDQIEGALLNLEGLRTLKHIDQGVVEDGIAGLRDELKSKTEENQRLLYEMQKMDGGIEREQYWLERIGFNMRGDQLL